MKIRKPWLVGLLLLFLSVLTGYFYAYGYFVWNVALYVSMIVLIFLEGGVAFSLPTIVKGGSKKAIVLSALLGGFLSAGGAALISVIVNVVIYHQGGAKETMAVTAAYEFLFWLVFILRLARSTGAKFFWKPFVGIIMCILLLLGTLHPVAELWLYDTGLKKCAAPTGYGTYTKKVSALVNNADLYVSPDGSDDADGSLLHPLATVEKARDLVRDMDKTNKNGITVAIKAGVYTVNSLVFTSSDSGTENCPVTYCSYGDGEVVLSGSRSLPVSSFSAVTDEEMLSRLKKDARDKVVCISLSDLGITAEKYGKLYAIGSYNTAEKYTGDWVGKDLPCELFVNGNRQVLARYPNGKEYLRTGKVVLEGDGKESADATVKPAYKTAVDPRSDIYKMDKGLSERIASWKTLDDVWMFGYWRWDWADASTPIGTVDHENLTISPKFVSFYGAMEGAPYYFYNVFEELDTPGEWYLDRTSGILYLYAPDDLSESSIELTLSTENVISAEVNYVTFDGLTVQGTRSDAINIVGDNNTVKNCLIKNVAGNALLMTGYNALALGNEVTRTGKGGILLEGGEELTLTPGNCRAENNLIHDWSELYETYQPAISVAGVGNYCTRNEMYNSPHEAITFYGNDHLIEGNVIHNVNLLTDDGGAIYSQRHWNWYGNVIRYNIIYDLGSEGHKPVGIYMDGHLSGEVIYGNLIVNVPGIGIQLAGGRDLIVKNNIVINTTQRSIDYGPGGFDDSSEAGGPLWEYLHESPWQTELWQQTYPAMQRFSEDFNDTDDPDFLPNPAYSEIKGNLIVSAGYKLGSISEQAYRYSDISGNAVYRMIALKKLFVDPDHGDYTLRDDSPVYKKIPDFEQIPFNKIGRY